MSERRKKKRGVIIPSLLEDRSGDVPLQVAAVPQAAQGASGMTASQVSEEDERRRDKARSADAPSQSAAPQPQVDQGASGTPTPQAQFAQGQSAAAPSQGAAAPQVAQGTSGAPTHQAQSAQGQGADTPSQGAAAPQAAQGASGAPTPQAQAAHGQSTAAPSQGAAAPQAAQGASGAPTPQAQAAQGQSAAAPSQGAAAPQAAQGTSGAPTSQADRNEKQGVKGWSTQMPQSTSGSSQASASAQGASGSSQTSASAQGASGGSQASASAQGASGGSQPSASAQGASGGPHSSASGQNARGSTIRNIEMSLLKAFFERSGIFIPDMGFRSNEELNINNNSNSNNQSQKSTIGSLIDRLRYLRGETADYNYSRQHSLEPGSAVTKLCEDNEEEDVEGFSLRRFVEMISSLIKISGEGENIVSSPMPPGSARSLGLYWPSKTELPYITTIIIDTSGSMTDNVSKSRIKNFILRLAKKNNYANIVMGDATVHDCREIINLDYDKLEKLLWKGSGGTRLDHVLWQLFCDKSKELEKRVLQTAEEEGKKSPWIKVTSRANIKRSNVILIITDTETEWDSKIAEEVDKALRGRKIIVVDVSPNGGGSYKGLQFSDYIYIKIGESQNNVLFVKKQKSGGLKIVKKSMVR